MKKLISVEEWIQEHGYYDYNLLKGMKNNRDIYVPRYFDKVSILDNTIKQYLKEQKSKLDNKTGSWNDRG